MDEVNAWCEGALEELGDPAEAVCSLFVRVVEDALKDTTDDLVATYRKDTLWVRLFEPGRVHPLMLSKDVPRMNGARLIEFGAEKIAPGLWALSPSLNMPGLIHGFVTLYDVSDPAPWESLIVIAEGGMLGTLRERCSRVFL